eukprot:GFUD01119861.1.p1 GENE.GFUD01119861.1~~GFUD01119861.1.p1  ORF type:complete len:558 (-),score=173.88 GFUD01119861.1:69-1742(-)
MIPLSLLLLLNFPSQAFPKALPPPYLPNSRNTDTGEIGGEIGFSGSESKNVGKDQGSSDGLPEGHNEEGIMGEHASLHGEFYEDFDVATTNIQLNSKLDDNKLSKNGLSGSDIKDAVKDKGSSDEHDVDVLLQLNEYDLDGHKSTHGDVATTKLNTTHGQHRNASAVDTSFTAEDNELAKAAISGSDKGDTDSQDMGEIQGIEDEIIFYHGSDIADSVKESSDQLDFGGIVEPNQEAMDEHGSTANGGVAEDFDVATTNVQLNTTLSEFGNMSIVDAKFIVDSELTKAHIDMEIKDFEELKAKIVLLENHLRQHANFSIVPSEELVETDHMLKDMDVKILEPYENKLKALKNHIKNEEIDDISLPFIETIVKNAEFFLDNSRVRLNDVENLEKEWESSEEEVRIESMEENVVGGDDQSDIHNPYEEFKRENIYDKHRRVHDDEVNLALLNADINEAVETQDSSSLAYSSLHPYLTPGLTMLVFLLLCSVVAWKLTKRRRVASRMVSQVQCSCASIEKFVLTMVLQMMARDLGYTELQTVGEGEKNYQGVSRRQYKLK